LTQTRQELAISKARASLILDACFFGTLALRLDVAVMPAGSGCNTMATDGKRLYFNPAFVDSLSHKELTGVVAHEVMHPALGHTTRRGHRDPELFNQAADYAINPLLVEAGFTLPAGALIADEFKGMHAEAIYLELQKRQRAQGSAQGAGKPGKGTGQQPGTGNSAPAGAQGKPGQQAAKGSPATGAFWDAPGADGGKASPAELAAERHEWETAVLQAAQTAKQAGNCPGFVKELAQAIRAPEIDWKDALRRYMTATSRDDYSWRVPNRRHLAGDYPADGWFLPSLHNESIGEVLIAVDTSGSVSSAELAAFASEINAILSETRPELVHVVYCDDAIAGEAEFRPDDYPVTLDCAGRGGTAFAPVWAWARNKGIEPVAAIYLTDLGCYGDSWGEEPAFPVLWCATAEGRAPFGEVVRLHID
jgi:predicted metal-dependent peptidase